MKKVFIGILAIVIIFILMIALPKFIG